MATKTLMTAEEFAHMNTAETEDYELVDGELIPMASGTPLHNLIRDRIVRHIGNYLVRTPVGGATGETDCRINGEIVRRPDLSIFLNERWEHLDLRRTPFPFAPDIAVEVVSPTEHMIDVSRKVHEYLGAGSQEVWLLDEANGEIQVRTEANIRLLRLDDVLESPLLPGFSVKVSDLLSGR